MDKPPAQERAERLLFIAVVLGIAGAVLLGVGASSTDDGAIVAQILGYVALVVGGGVMLVGVVALGVQLGVTAADQQKHMEQYRPSGE
ncbi:hypothetical protein [Nocardioides alkalitolerans]|uniref:hypothetical protein n=1 Tax=Nocardioides alkalitolerans TaxID=281714 RepID=UPI00040318DF|nr:hypothetical protein [Nocardioides alkalitolerans]